MTANPGSLLKMYEQQPETADVLEEVCVGLNQKSKSLSPKFFYDEVGSRLFEEITQLPEYYLTRTELALLDRYLPALKELLGKNLCIVEYGSGSSVKIRRVIGALSPDAYMPIDISRDYLLAGAERLAKDFTSLDVFPLCADFTQPIALPDRLEKYTKVGFFPGSSIGNFPPDKAQAFLDGVADSLDLGSYLLIGVDCKKDPQVLEAAYDDSAGVTARFNLNLLSHLNDKLGADFESSAFEHVARYNQDQGCIDMFLRSKSAQTVAIQGNLFEFAKGELMHTESSYKYLPTEFIALADRAGFSCLDVWQDENQYFGVYLLQVGSLS